MLINARLSPIIGKTAYIFRKTVLRQLPLICEYFVFA